MNPLIKYKYVFFGKTRTLQLQCPKCEIWQFSSPECDNCELVFGKFGKKERSEYRCPPPTWRDRISGKLKESIFQRDEFTCQYCGIHCYESYAQDRNAVTIDHALPVSAGGRNNIENLITCCRECNFIKHDKIFQSFEEAREYIKKRRHLP